MITMERVKTSNFAAVNPAIGMSKTKQQIQATDYAMDYLKRLLKIEDILDRELDRLIDQRVRRYMEEKHFLNNL